MTLHWQSTAKIIGIDYYSRKSGLKSLPAPSKDAEAIASLFEAYGEHQQIFIERIPCEQNKTQQGKSAQRVKSDEVVKQAELEKAITELLTPPDNNPPDTAFFFFSGHGVRQEIDGKVEVYLATSDRRPNKDGYEGIPISWLGQKIQESKVKEIIVWLDCCYSGELFNYCPDNKRYCFITATTSYNEAFTSYQQGELTTRLKAGLNPQGKSDQRVDSHDLCQFLAKNQPQYGQRFQYRTSDAPIPLTTLHPRYFIDRCPYIALNYFQEKDAQFFYGRNQLINKLVETVKQDENRLIKILGPSGSGKSSLMRAGLLYKLKRGGAIANRVSSNNWHYIPPFNPTDQPLSQLSQSLLSSDWENWGQETPIIMMIDQFEECFTLCNELTRKAFIERLRELIADYSNLKIIIAMRDDFRGRLKEIPPFYQKMNRVIVPHLNREEIEQAIMQPAKLVGLEIEEALKQQLINDVEDYPGSLPLLQYALTELWKETWLKNKETVLRLSVYEKLGRIEGTLEKRAEAIYNSLSPDYQKVAKRIFLELTHVGDLWDTRRRIKLGHLVNSHHSLEILNDVTSLLANEENRLLIRSDSDTETSQNLIPLAIRQKNSLNQSRKAKSRSQVVIDVVHEALIRNWQRLEDWKQEYQTAMMIERRIEQAAQQWKEGGDLWQIAGLVIADNYLQEYGELGMLDGTAEEFIKQTRHKVKRNKWTQRGVIGVILAFAALSAYTAIDANHQKIEAQKQGIIAQANLAKLQLANPQNINPLVLALDNVRHNLLLNKTHLTPETYNILAETVEQIPKQSTLRSHKNTVKSVAFSQDGKYIASSSSDNTIKIWDALNPTDTPLYTLKGHQSYVNSIAFSPDGRYIVSGSSDKTIKIWPTLNPNHTPVHTFKGHLETVYAVAFSPDGQYIISGSSDKTIKIWDAFNRSNTPLHTLQGHQNSVYAVAFSPDGQYIASGSSDRTIKVWDALNPTNTPLHTFNGHQSYVYSVAFSPDGKYIISGSSDKTIKIWDTLKRTKTALHTLKGHQNTIYTVAFSPDGKYIASGSSDKTIKIWDALNRTHTPLHTFKGHLETIYAVAFSPDNQSIISGSSDRTVKIWHQINNWHTSLHTFQGHRNYVNSVAFSPDGQYIASASSDNTIKIWHLKDDLNQTNAPLYTFKGHQNTIYAVAFSPDGKYIVSGSSDRTVKVWDLFNGQETPLHTFKDHRDYVYTVAFSPNGKYIVSGSSDRTIKIWHWENTRNQKNTKDGPLHTFKGHQNTVSSVAFSPDGKYIVSGSYDSTIKIWSSLTKTNTPLHTFKGHQSYVNSVAFSPNGQYIASGSYDGTVKVWAAFNGQHTPLRTLHNHQSYQASVTSVAFSPDGQYLVSGNYDNTIKIWDPFNSPHTPLRTFTSHQASVTSVGFSPDGKYLVSGSWDKTIKIWQAGWQDWVAYACGWLRLEPDFALPASEKESEQEQLALEGAVKVCLDLGGWQAQEKADFLVRQGLAIARTKEDIEDITEPMQKLKKAQHFNPQLDLTEDKQKVITYVEQRLVAASRQQSENGNLAAVQAKLEQLEQLNSEHLELDIPQLRTELMTTIAIAYLQEAEILAISDAADGAQAKFREIEQLIESENLDQRQIYQDELAESLVNIGLEIAQIGSIEGTMLLYEQAPKIDPIIEIDAFSWHVLCRFGTIYGYGKDVLEACERAVNKALAGQKSSFQDSRGLARALTGDRKGAILDFQAFVQDEMNDEEERQTRQEWIDKLQAGDSIKSIFTPQILEDLKLEDLKNE